MRQDGRKNDELRNVRIIPDFLKHPYGSVLIEMGDTRVITAVSVEDNVPSFLNPEEQGWLTAEYSLLPSSTRPRSSREATRGKVGGRTHEIQRLIGRSLRAALDLTRIPGKTLWVDCDVIQADGGTRTASITGAFVALKLAISRLLNEGVITEDPLKWHIAAISVGIVDGEILLDLNYEEDYRASVDMNIVMNEEGNFIEIQGTAEEGSFRREELSDMLSLGEKGIRELIAIQKKTLEGVT